MFQTEPPKCLDHYDGDAAMRYDSVYLTCSQTLTSSQLSLLREIKQKI